MIKQSEVTIIIPHIFLNKETDFALKECLKSLDETVPEIKKIVAINGTKFEDDFETVRYPNVEFIVLERQGQCAAVNAAISMINTPWIFITNNDMIYAPNWWENLVSLKADYLGHPTVDLEFTDYMCISPMLIEPRVGAPTFEVFFAGGAGGDFDKQKWLNFAKYKTLEYKKDRVRTGFNFPVLIKRELWDTIGGYDINYDPWGSNGDSDLQYKIMLAGIQPYQNTNCIVYHFSQTSGTFEPKNDSHRMRNYAYFQEKWGFMRTDNRIWESDFTIPTKEEGRIFMPEWEGKYAHK